MPVFNENGATQVPSATAEFAFMENGDPALKNCTPPQLAERLGLVNGDGEFSVADIITKGPWVDIRAFLPAGYVTDGSVDYTTEIQAAIDSGAGEIFTGNDRSVFRVSRIVGRSNLKLTGNATFNFSNNASYATSVLDPLILFQGSAGSAVLLTADVAGAATTITIATTTGLVAGDLIEVATPTHDGGFIDTSVSVKNGEMITIKSVDSGTQITTNTPILDLNGYTVANGAQIRKITPVENVTIGQDITIIGKGRPQPSGQGDHGIVVFYGKNINIHCRMNDVDLRAVYIHAYDFRINNMRIIHPQKGTSSETNYGISPFGSSTYGEVAHNTLENMRHGFVSSHLSTALGTFYGVSRAINVHHNTVRNTWLGGIATHNDTEILNIYDNTVVGCVFGINVRDRRANVINNTLIDNGQHIYLSAQPSNLVISGNKAYRGGLLLTSTGVDTGYDLDDWTITDNYGFSSKGMNVYGNTPATSHKRLVVKGNVIRNDPGEGGNYASIRVNGAFTGVQVAENVVAGNANGNGIRVEGITDAEIMRNTVRNVSAIAYTFVAGIANTYAKGNTAKGYGTYVSGSSNLANTATWATDNTDMGA